jgi:pyruvate,water dikinase
MDMEGYWDWDKIHAPRPLTPLGGDAIAMAMAEGFTIAQHDFGSPLALRCRMVNNYLYASFAPDGTYAGRSQADVQEYVTELDKLAAGVGDRWVNEWEPRVVSMLQKDHATDYSKLDDAALLAALKEQLDALVYWWTIHGWINLVLVPATALTEFYNAEFHPDDPNEAFQLMQGYRTKSVDAAKGLWRLSRIVKDSPALTRVFETLEPGAMLPALDATPEGKAFVAELRTYLNEYGWRSDGIYEIADATWREDPSIPLNTIQGYLRLGEDANPERTLERATQKREELTRAAKAKLAGDEAKLKHFEELMEAAKHNLAVTEDHSFWIDQMGTASFRRFALAFGERLVAKGLLEKPEDVFFLYKTELHDTLAQGIDRKPLVAQRGADMQKWAKVLPPDHLGEPTPNNDDPFFIAIVDKMLGLLPVEPSTEPNVITGVAASPGVVQGTAKVVRTLVEASKLQQGDIMVCEMTVPTWVPLFATVSAVVADSGGILSHCAIVAREFRLPAVVGTRVGTTTIQDGMQITVDGTKGRVRIDSRA